MPVYLTTLIQQFPDEPWFPGAAQELERAFWNKAGRGKQDTYSSAHWLGLETSTPPVPIGTLNWPSGRVSIVENLAGAVAQRYERLCLRLYGGQPDYEMLELVQRAIGLVSIVPALAESAGILVRVIHVLHSPGPEFDVSHSDPELPFSIFVSLPVGQAMGALRLAESIIHESMHLQLSLIEYVCPLVSDREAVGYSPWMEYDRPLAGLLHGLYVFGAISAFYERLLKEPSVTEVMKEYSRDRRFAIAQEVDALRHLVRSAGLTPEGRALASYLMAVSAVPPSEHEPSH